MSKQKMNGFYKMFFSMYFILVFQNVITLSVNLADNMMLGANGENIYPEEIEAIIRENDFVLECIVFFSV